MYRKKETDRQMERLEKKKDRYKSEMCRQACNLII